MYAYEEREKEYSKVSLVSLNVGEAKKSRKMYEASEIKTKTSLKPNKVIPVPVFVGTSSVSSTQICCLFLLRYRQHKQQDTSQSARHSNKDCKDAGIIFREYVARKCGKFAEHW